MRHNTININILGRRYPVRVSSEERAVVMEAARVISDKIKSYKSEYKVHDELDLAIMCCLEIMTEHIKYRDDSEESLEKALSKLVDIQSSLQIPVSPEPEE